MMVHELQKLFSAEIYERDWEGSRGRGRGRGNFLKYITNYETFFFQKFRG
jgi:hypothetical protein